jgi:hypothetical protein
VDEHSCWCEGGNEAGGFDDGCASDPSLRSRLFFVCVFGTDKCSEDFLGRGESVKWVDSGGCLLSHRQLANDGRRHC